MGILGKSRRVVLTGLFALAACDTQAPPAGTPPTPEAPNTPAPRDPETPVVEVPLASRFTASGAYQIDPAMPLAYRRVRTFEAQKGDQYDNKRAADPENYAITRPPERVATTRPMVEWEPMKALLFAYPSYAAQYQQTTQTFVQIADAAIDHGEVWILVDTSQAETIFKNKLLANGMSQARLNARVKFVRQPFDTYWLIDYGPLPLVDTASDTYAVGDFRYYHERPVDDAVPTLFGRGATKFGEPTQATVYRMPLTTEGGTFQATTDGVCITSSRQIYNMSCYAGECRESILGLSLPALQTHQYTLEMESVLRQYAGCKDLVITHSVTDDGTGHIDMYLKILDDDRVLLGEYREPFALDVQRDNAKLMDDNAAFIEAYVKPDGGRFQVVRLPMPGHRTVDDFWGEYDIPFTYINSTFFNGLNLWPAYTFPEWEASRDAAQAIWDQVLPDMEHVWIDSEELSYQSGAIHCVTRTIPKKAPGEWVEDGACADGVCGGVEGGYDGECRLGNAPADLCWGPDWLCGCNDCRNCPATVPEVGCNGVTWRGCCDGGDVLYCENATLKRLPCGGTGCGWSTDDGFYNCGLEGGDPSGDNPQVCTCEPQCDGRTCGPDGCGGVCGTCGEGEPCVDGECRTDCATCTPGQLGCDGDVSWLCVAGPEGCHSEQRVDCAASGLVCADGDCVQGAADPDVVEPDVVEPDVQEPDVDAPDTSAPDTQDPDSASEDTRGEDTVGPTDTSPPADTGAEVVVTGGRDDGCAAGGEGIAGIGLALVGMLRARRSARARRV